MNKFIRVMNYILPIICFANILFATNSDARMAWFVATTGWIAHLLESRKNV
jgi:uncharacterized membrane protein YjjB (DUF3815 family)